MTSRATFHYAVGSRAMLIAVLAVLPAAAQRKTPYDLARQRMVQTAVVDVGVTNPRVIQAMLATPRHEFVSHNLRDKAYLDMALPIGQQQTISSPFIVAFMTEAIDPQPTDKVLEIGTGSGYQAAVLSPLVDEVYTIEIVEPLGLRAERTLNRLRFTNIHVKVGDGFQGWPEHAPFDKIIVTCSPESVPQPLVDQLKEGGLMVIPVGERYQQTLYLMRKKNSQVAEEALVPTLFVPMTGVAEEGRRIKPDALDPKVINGSFEDIADDNGFVPGWYYERQFLLETDKLAPDGQRFITFRNDDPGRDAHLLQGFPIDGSRIGALRLSAAVRYENVRSGLNRTDLPAVAVSFYDEQRRDLGYVLLGPFQGSQEWHRVERTIRIPPQCREGILRIGLFGATGSISFDNVQMSPTIDEKRLP